MFIEKIFNRNKQPFFSKVIEGPLTKMNRWLAKII